LPSSQANIPPVAWSWLADCIPWARSSLWRFKPYVPVLATLGQPEKGRTGAGMAEVWRKIVGAAEKLGAALGN